jgi:hypothetical protein
LVMQAECMNESRMWGKSVEQDWMQTGQKESRVWWEECGTGLDMQPGYEGEQDVVGRVWNRAGYADRV